MKIVALETSRRDIQGARSKKENHVPGKLLPGLKMKNIPVRCDLWMKFIFSHLYLLEFVVICGRNFEERVFFFLICVSLILA